MFDMCSVLCQYRYVGYDQNKDMTLVNEIAQGGYQDTRVRESEENDH
jgi:hypothetical protein